MANSKIDKKVRLLDFLPYGICSQLATAIEGRNNPYATKIPLGNNPEATLKECEQHRKNSTERANYMCKTGLAKDSNHPCGTPSKSRRFRQLTRKGLEFLAKATDIEEWEELLDRANDGNGKDNYYHNTPASSTDHQNTTHEPLASSNESRQQLLSGLLLESVMEGTATPFTLGFDLVKDIHLSTSKYSQNQLYNIWRLSHVNAMFRANGFLTNLDRRPYNHLIIDGIDSPESYEKYIQRNGHTVASLTYYVLSHWYTEHPGFYKIDQQLPDMSEEARQRWLHTPVFYSTRELPNFNSKESAPVMGWQRKMNTVFAGLAMGRKVNYLCYHGNRGEAKWNTKREMLSQEAMQQTIHSMKTHNPDIPNSTAVNSALYFCSSIYQFAAIFDRTIERHKKGLSTTCIMEKPFNSIHAIPVNDTGAVVLWCLMDMAPYEAEQRICNILLKQDSRFQFRMDYYYPLTYDGKLVFAGYTMNIKKIHHVLVDYLNGKTFYVACFAEQVKWYKTIFPTLTFL